MSARTLVRGPIMRLAAVSLGSNIVDGIRVAAFAVLTTAYAKSALEVALVATVATLPKVFLSIPIGVMLDRWSKLRTLYLVNLARALILLGLAVTLYLGAGSILLLCAFALLFGTLEEFYDAASVLVVPDLTEPNEYLTSNATWAPGCAPTTTRTASSTTVTSRPATERGRPAWARCHGS